MEIGGQIKKYRNERSMSQDTLAERIYVSRQTISNWENNKSYPDINSLVLLSKVFGVSIDILIKGDVEEMKEKLRKEELRKEEAKSGGRELEEFQRLGGVFTVLMFVMILSPVPLMYFLKNSGIIIWGVVAAATFWAAFRVEKMKKDYDVQTYREIIAFSEGKKLDEIEKAREEGKRPYQKAVIVFCVAAVTLLVEGGIVALVFLLGKNV